MLAVTRTRFLLACALISGMGLSGCAVAVIYKAATKGDFFPVKTVETAYDPQTQARIRIVGGFEGNMTVNSRCSQKRYTADRGKFLLSALTVLTTGEFAASQSIGMPRSGKYDSFNEFTLPAGEPTTLKFNYYVSSTVGNMTTTQKCDVPGVYFMPRKGQDYEASFVVDKGLCWARISELDAQGNASKAEQVETFAAPACPAEPSGT